MSALSQGVFVALLHGVPTGPSLWDGVRALLARAGVAAAAPALAGTQPGDPPPDSLDAALRALADSVSAAADGRRILLVGQDWGGLLAAGLAAEGRVPVAGVVLTSVPLGLGWAPAVLGARPPLDRWVYRRYSGALYLRHGASPAARPSLAAAFGAHTRDPRMPAAMQALARLLPQAPLARWRRALAHAPFPVRFVHGLGDPFVPAAAPLLRALAWPSARAVLLPGARHYAPADQPAAYARAILEILPS